MTKIEQKVWQYSIEYCLFKKSILIYYNWEQTSAFLFFSSRPIPENLNKEMHIILVCT